MSYVKWNRRNSKQQQQQWWAMHTITFFACRLQKVNNLMQPFKMLLLQLLNTIFALLFDCISFCSAKIRRTHWPMFSTFFAKLVKLWSSVLHYVQLKIEREMCSPLGKQVVQVFDSYINMHCRDLPRTHPIIAKPLNLLFAFTENFWDWDCIFFGCCFINYIEFFCHSQKKLSSSIGHKLDGLPKKERRWQT